MGRSIAVLQQKQMPLGFPGRYEDSGWCCFESSVSLIAKTETGKYAPPPRTPARFAELIETRQFTNGADADTVKTLYNATFTSMANSCEKLSFARVKWHADEAVALAESLPLLTKLRQLDLDDNELGDEGARIIAEAVSTHSTIQDLCLEKNGITGLGVKAMAAFLSTSTAQI